MPRGYKRLLPVPGKKGDRITNSYSRLAKQLEFWSNGTLSHKEAVEYAHDIQRITSLNQHGVIDADELADFFYDIYDELLDDYGIDMHDNNFYPGRVK